MQYLHNNLNYYRSNSHANKGYLIALSLEPTKVKHSLFTKEMYL